MKMICPLAWTTDIPKPAPTVRTIEPLGNFPDMKLMRDKMNEVVAWINAKGAV